VKTDCLIIGYWDTHFPDYLRLVRSMGEDSGAHHDLNLAFVESEGYPYRAMDLLNHLHYRGRPGPHKIWHNYDFLWPTIAYLGTYLHRRGLTFDYVNNPHFHQELLRSKLREQDILTVAVTTTHYIAPHQILDLVSFIRKENPRTTIVVGGPFVYGQSRVLEEQQLQELFAFIGADIYVINQTGEQALVNLVHALKEGRPLGQVENIAYRRSSLAGRQDTVARLRGRRTTGDLVSVGELGEAPPDRAAQAQAWAEAHPERAAELVRRLRAAAGSYVLTQAVEEDHPLVENRIDYSLFPRAEIGEFVSLWTSKSCPYACAFCGFPERAGAYTVLPVEALEHELETLRDMGVRHLTFIDDTFNVPKARFKELLRMLIRRRFGFHWNSFYRGDQGDAETVELMAEAGCQGVFLGVESGSDRMLERMNKTARRANYVQAIGELKRAGILTHTNFIVGFPGETVATVEESISLIEETAPDTYRAQLWYCDPMTPVWRQRRELGIQGGSFQWSHATMDSQEAADLVDRMFVCVENSTWLPQHSFEQWSVLYLQHYGMPAAQIDRYVRYFNAAVKEKLVYGGVRPPAPTLMEGMAEAVRFAGGRIVTAAEETADAYSAGRYLAAERWARQEFSGAPAAALWLSGRQRCGDGERNWESVILPVRDSDELLAACTDWLGEGAGLVVARHGAVGAIRLGGEANEEKIAAALRHGAWGLYVVRNSLRMKLAGAASPALEAALVWGDSDEALRDHPKLAAGLRVVIEVHERECILRYDAAVVRREDVSKLWQAFSEAVRV
jgi:radical SAM superfamily enzyme YgiQ (UPF0313 family)